MKGELTREVDHGATVAAADRVQAEGTAYVEADDSRQGIGINGTEPALDRAE